VPGVVRAGRELVHDQPTRRRTVIDEKQLDGEHAAQVQALRDADGEVDGGLLRRYCGDLLGGLFAILLDWLYYFLFGFVLLRVLF
jgi:hypothetical protein